MVNTEIRLILFFTVKDGEALYSQQKQDQELTVAQIMNSLLQLKLKKVGKTTRPFRYDLNQIPYDYKVKVKSLSGAWLLATPWTAGYQAPPSMGFSRQQYWSGVPLPSPVVFPTFFNLSLNLEIRSSWSEPQSAPSLVFANSVFDCKEENQSDFGIDHLVMSLCRVFSYVVGRGCLLWPVHSLGKTLLAFALLHFVLQGQICPVLQVSLDFLLLHSRSLWWNEHCFLVLVLEGLVVLYRTIQLQLLQH